MFPNAIHYAGNNPPIDAPYAKQKHALGARLILEDGREFIYAKAGGTLNTDLGAKNALTQHISYTTIAANAAKGAKSIVLDTAVTDGAAGTGVIAADELVGGYLVIFPHASNAINRRITSNTATTNVGGGVREMTIGIDAPLPCAIEVDTDHGEAMASPYLNVQTLTGSTSSVMGMPTVPATIGQFLWLQKSGPVWIAPQGEVSVGNNNRNVVFRHDGSIDEYDATDATTIKAQHAGYVLANAPGGGQGAAFIMLQI